MWNIAPICLTSNIIYNWLRRNCHKQYTLYMYFLWQFRLCTSWKFNLNHTYFFYSEDYSPYIVSWKYTQKTRQFWNINSSDPDDIVTGSNYNRQAYVTHQVQLASECHRSHMITPLADVRRVLLCHMTSLGYHELATHWGRDEMNNISQTAFSNAFSSMKMFEFRSKFHWSLFPRVQSITFQHWFR